MIDGSHDNPGAVTAEQREAMQFGMQDGLATREQCRAPFLARRVPQPEKREARV